MGLIIYMFHIYVGFSVLFENCLLLISHGNNIQNKFDGISNVTLKMFPITRFVVYTHKRKIMINTLNDFGNLLINMHFPWFAFLFEHTISFFY
jgi:hypothetical protein